MSANPGYRLNDPTWPPSPVTTRQFEELKASLLFGPDDVAALKRAHDGLKPQVEAILVVWCGFVGGNPLLLRYFSTSSGEPVGPYLDAVRKRFGQWILDTCSAEYDTAWLAYQDEIGKHRMGKNRTDGGTAAAHVPMSQLSADHPDLGDDEAVPRKDGRRAGRGRSDARGLDEVGYAAGDSVGAALRERRRFLTYQAGRLRRPGSRPARR